MITRGGRFVHAALAASLLAAGCARGQTITRGPYLQSGTATSVVVCWRADVAANGRVRYGRSPGALTGSVDAVALTRDHAVTLSGLEPGTTYWYAVETSSATLASGAAFTFTTPPPAGAPAPIRFWVVGDSGTADGNARAVRDAYDAYSAGTQTNFWIMLGDNAYDTGTEAEVQRAVFETFAEPLRRSVLWSAFGNHDGYSSNAGRNSGPYFDAFVFPKNGEAGGVPSGTEAYYSFDVANVHLVSLDAYGSSRLPGSPMLRWLEEDLAATRQPWIVAFWHHPPYTKGTHDSDTETELVEMRRYAVPILETAGVDLVLGGHSHVYERSFLIDGHYGTSDTFAPSMKKDGGSGRPGDTGAYWKPAGRTPHAGTVYVVLGSSAKKGNGPLNHPAMAASRSGLGSLVVDVSQDRLDAVFLRETVAVTDAFTVVKSRHRRLPGSAAPADAPVHLGRGR